MGRCMQEILWGTPLITVCRCLTFVLPLNRREFPGELDKIRIWFRDYKKPDGKPENQFGYDDTWQNKEFTLNVIEETHGFYAKLKSGERENTEGLSLV